MKMPERVHHLHAHLRPDYFSQCDNSCLDYCRMVPGMYFLPHDTMGYNCWYKLSELVALQFLGILTLPLPEKTAIFLHPPVPDEMDLDVCAGEISTGGGIGSIQRTQHLVNLSFIKIHSLDTVGHPAVLCVCRRSDLYSSIIVNCYYGNVRI